MGVCVWVFVCVCMHRGDFRVAFNAEGEGDKNCSVFHLLEQACLEMADVSYKIQTTQGSRIGGVANLPNGLKPLYKNFVYSRMLWSKSGYG